MEEKGGMDISSELPKNELRLENVSDKSQKYKDADGKDAFAASVSIYYIYRGS